MIFIVYLLVLALFIAGIYYGILAISSGLEVVKTSLTPINESRLVAHHKRSLALANPRIKQKKHVLHKVHFGQFSPIKHIT